MQTRPLGEKGPDVPIICLGTWPLGGGMGAIPENKAIATIHAGIDAGATFIDTAEGYRDSEALLGKALTEHRNKVFLATKVSGEHTRSHILLALENSLRALRTDYIDLYQLHCPRPQPIADTMAVLLEARDTGKIRYIGLSNFSADQTEKAINYGPIHSSQPRYNLLHREAERFILPCLARNGIGAIVHSPLGKGILTGSYRPGHTFADDDERSSHSVFDTDYVRRGSKASEKLREFAADHNRTLSELAIAWTLAHPAVTSSIVGAKTHEQARANARAANWNLSNHDLVTIDKLLDWKPDA